MLLKTDDSHCLFFGFCFSFTYLIPLKVILEDLPDEFATALREYNRQVTDVFSQYLTAVAADLERERGEENKLPLSGIGKIRSLIILYVTIFFTNGRHTMSCWLFWRQVKFLSGSITSSFALQGSVFRENNYLYFTALTRITLDMFCQRLFVCLFVCLFLFFLQATLTSQLCATAKRKAWCYFGNSISRSKRIILGKFLTLG